MATIPPNIVGLFPTRRLEVNTHTKELSLVGMYSIFAFPRYPTSPLELTVFAMVNGGRGEGILELAVYPLVQPGADFPGKWIYRQQRWAKFVGDPNFSTTVEFRLRRLIFSKPGDYLFVLAFDGKFVTDRRMSAIKEGD
jgi:hypothetical protein